MAHQIPKTEPSTLFLGDTWEWKISETNYSVDDYTLSYVLRSDSDTISITAGTDGDYFLVSVGASTTGGYSEGVYNYVARATDTDGNVYTVRRGAIEIVDPTVDSRPHCKIMLDAIEATLEAKSSGNMSALAEKETEGRKLKYLSYEELQRARARYQEEYNQYLSELDEESGKGSNNLVKIEFRGVS